MNEWAAPRCCQCDRPKPVGVAALEASKPLDEEAFLRVEEANDFMTGSGYVTERSFSARPEQIKEAAAEWAGYSGWYPISLEEYGWIPVTPEGAGAAYRARMYPWLAGGIRLRVIPQTVGEKTDVRFETGFLRIDHPVCWGRREGPDRADFAGAAEHFADGLSDELTFQLRARSGGGRELLGRRRERLRKIDRAYTIAYWLVPAAFAPVTAIAGLVTRSGFGTMAALSWMLMLCSLNVLLQARHIGMRVLAGIFPIAVLAGLGMGLGFTLAATLGGH